MECHFLQIYGITWNNILLVVWNFIVIPWHEKLHVELFHGNFTQWNHGSSTMDLSPNAVHWSILHPTLTHRCNRHFSGSQYFALLPKALESRAKGHHLLWSFRLHRINCSVSVLVRKSKTSHIGVTSCCSLINPPLWSKLHMRLQFCRITIICLATWSTGELNQRASFTILLLLV